MKRVLAIYLPFLPTDRLRERDEGELSIADCRLSIEEAFDHQQSKIDHRKSTIPVVTTTAQGQTLHVVHLNETAGRGRIRAGQTLAEARAMLPTLVTYDDDPSADRRRLEALAVFAQQFSPTVHLEGDDTLLLDVSGCERLFDGEENLLRRAVEAVRGQGFTVRAGVADTPGAAWALAHAHPEPAIIAQRGQSVAELAPLPVWALRIETSAVEALASVGVETIASLLHLPRSSLVSRFGERLLERIDQALGDLSDVLRPHQPPAALSRRIEWGAPIGEGQLLHEALRRATEAFCEELARRVAGVRQVFVTFSCPYVPTQDGPQRRGVTMALSLSQPTRSARHLLKLLKIRMESLQLPAPPDSLTVWASCLEPLDDPQQELFSTQVVDQRALGDLLDRLVLRLGASAVVRAELVRDHQPERAFRYVSVVPNDSSFSSPPPEVRTSSRPLRLSHPPIPIAAVSVVPDGPPISFRLPGLQQTAVHSVGPERIETGWWRGPHLQRDYYRTVTGDGRRGWLFRDRKSGNWFLHGWFD